MFIKRAVDQKDIAAPCCDGKLLLIGHDFETAGLDRKFFGKRNVNELVVFGFFFAGSPVFA